MLLFYDSNWQLWQWSLPKVFVKFARNFLLSLPEKFTLMILCHNLSVNPILPQPNKASDSKILAVTAVWFITLNLWRVDRCLVMAVVQVQLLIFAVIAAWAQLFNVELKWHFAWNAELMVQIMDVKVSWFPQDWQMVGRLSGG